MCARHKHSGYRAIASWKRRAASGPSRLLPKEDIAYEEVVEAGLTEHFDGRQIHLVGDLNTV